MKSIRKISFFSIFGLTLLLVQQSGIAGTKSHWGYTGHEGPGYWGKLDPDYHMCKAGRKQSPVNLTRSVTGESRSIHFWYSSKPDNIVNNGHTIQINMKGGSSITVNHKTYQLLQFHFHSPSEHQVDGRHAAMVIHFVHKASDGQLGVVGLLLDKGRSNKLISQLWKYIPKKHGGEESLPGSIDIKSILPVNRAYYNYTGSLTTPPCSEGVNWMVLKGRAYLSNKQIHQFTSLFPRSIRPIQQLYGRKIFSK